MVIFVMGVSGTGKTTIGKLVAEKLTLPFYDADDYHEISNIEKMKSGNPLTDDDRNSWLKEINELALKNIDGCVIACSALKEKYRTTLSSKIDSAVYWVFLHGDYQQILDRIKLREDHFMGAEMLKSQFEVLEEPQQSISVNVSAAPSEIAERVIEKIR